VPRKQYCLPYLFSDTLLLINPRSVFLTPLCAMQAKIGSRGLHDKAICHALPTAQDRVRSQANAAGFFAGQNDTEPGIFPSISGPRITIFSPVWFGLFVHPFSHTCNIGHVKFTHLSPTLHNLSNWQLRWIVRMRRSNKTCCF